MRVLTAKSVKGVQNKNRDDGPISVTRSSGGVTVPGDRKRDLRRGGLATHAVRAYTKLEGGVKTSRGNEP